MRWALLLPTHRWPPPFTTTASGLPPGLSPSRSPVDRLGLGILPCVSDGSPTAPTPKITTPKPTRYRWPPVHIRPTPYSIPSEPLSSCSTNACKVEQVRRITSVTLASEVTLLTSQCRTSPRESKTGTSSESLVQKVMLSSNWINTPRVYGLEELRSLRDASPVPPGTSLDMSLRKTGGRDARTLGRNGAKSFQVDHRTAVQ